jgi:hypothetical protein
MSSSSSSSVQDVEKVTKSDPLKVIDLLEKVQRKASNLQAAKFLDNERILQTPEQLEAIQRAYEERMDGFRDFRSTEAGGSWVRAQAPNFTGPQPEIQPTATQTPLDVDEKEDYNTNINRLKAVKKELTFANTVCGEVKQFLEERLDSRDWDGELRPILQSGGETYMILRGMLRLIKSRGLGEAITVRTSLLKKLDDIPAASSPYLVGEMITKFEQVLLWMRFQYDAVTTTQDDEAMQRAARHALANVPPVQLFKYCPALLSSDEKVARMEAKLLTTAENSVIANEMFRMKRDRLLFEVIVAGIRAITNSASKTSSRMPPSDSMGMSASSSMVNVDHLACLAQQQEQHQLEQDDRQGIAAGAYGKVVTGPGPCYAFQRGECQRGTSCRFTHGEASGKSAGLPHTTAPRGFAPTSQSTPASAPPATPQAHSSRKCVFHLQGHCNEGANCRFAHDTNVGPGNTPGKGSSSSGGMFGSTH